MGKKGRTAPTWCGARRAGATPDGEPAEIVIFVDRASGRAMATTEIPEGSGVAPLGGLESALSERPDELPKPRLVVDDEKLAKALRKKWPALEVEVAPVPEVDEALAKLAKVTPPRRSYGEAGVTPETGARFFKAAAAARKVLARIEEPIRVDAPGYELDGAVLTAEAPEGEPPAVILLKNVEDFHTAAENPEAAPTGGRSVVWAPVQEAPAPLVAEVRARKWDAPDASSVPLAFAAANDTLRLGGERDLRAMADVLEALTAAFGKWKGDRGEEPRTFEKNGITLTQPHPDVESEEDEDDDPNAELLDAFLGPRIDALVEAGIVEPATAAIDGVLLMKGELPEGEPMTAQILRSYLVDGLPTLVSMEPEQAGGVCGVVADFLEDPLGKAVGKGAKKLAKGVRELGPDVAAAIRRLPEADRKRLAEERDGKA